MHLLGKNIRYLRKQSSKTQSEIASLIQKGQTTIGNWENGISEPSLSELLIISNYFDISVDTLLKIDLAADYPHPGLKRRRATPSYEHSATELPEAREEADGLSFVLQEIRDIRTELAELHSRLPKQKTDDQGPAQQGTKNNGQSL
jgi:transcriptional regulator with XRE-family HTH domain